MIELFVHNQDNRLQFLQGAVHRLEVSNSYHFPLHQHKDFHEAVLLLEGEMRHRVNGRLIQQRKDQLLFLPIQSVHSLQCKESKFINIILPIHWLQDGEIEVDCQDPQLIDLSEDEAGFLENLYSRFSTNVDLNLSHIQYYRMVLTLVEWILSSQNGELSNKKGEEPGWYTRAMIKLSSGEWNPESVTHLAELCNVSPEHLSRVWKHQTGRTPVQYLLDLRLDKAARQLKISNITVLEVSQKAGYDSPGYFSQKFKERFNLSPAQYRKQMRKYT